MRVFGSLILLVNQVSLAEQPYHQSEQLKERRGYKDNSSDNDIENDDLVEQIVGDHIRAHTSNAADGSKEKCIEERQSGILIVLDAVLVACNVHQRRQSQECKEDGQN